MLKLSLCDYSDTYILLSEIILIKGAGDDPAARQEDEQYK